MPDIKTDDGCTIHAEIEGPESAPVLMLSNSLGTNLHMWDDQVAPFTKHFRLVRYDRRGHGKSSVPKGPYTMERLGRDVLAVLDGLGYRENQLVRTVDGRHGRAMARRQCAEPHRQARPVQHVVLLPRQDGVGRPHQAGARKGPGSASSTPIWSAGSPRNFASARRKTMDAHAGDVRRHQCRRLYRLRRGDPRYGSSRRLLPKITAPTLVIAGKHDPATPLEGNEFIAQHIPGAKIAVLDAAHIANMEQPQVYADTVLGFLLN